MKLCPKCHKRYDDAVRFCPHDGTVLPDPVDNYVGQRLMEQFDIQQRCGEGAMGRADPVNTEIIEDRRGGTEADPADTAIEAPMGEAEEAPEALVNIEIIVDLAGMATDVQKGMGIAADRKAGR